MTFATIPQRITKVLERPDEKPLSPETTLDSLDLSDSLDHLIFVMELENEFGIEINDDDAEGWATLTDVVGSVLRGLAATEDNGG